MKYYLLLEIMIFVYIRKIVQRNVIVDNIHMIIIKKRMYYVEKVHLIRKELLYMKWKNQLK